MSEKVKDAILESRISALLAKKDEEDLSLYIGVYGCAGASGSGAGADISQHAATGEANGD